MEKLGHYKNIARAVIEDLMVQKKTSRYAVQYQMIADEASGNYLLLRNGWQGETRLYGILVHLEVTEQGKVWLHQDNTDFIVADMLLEKGIPQNEIVLGFQPPIMRPDTEFAVG